MTTPAILNSLQALLEKEIKENDVPGATLAVLYKDKTYTAAAGILNIETKVEADQDSIFQIGSITKVLTATLIMQLADEGKLDLDKPIQTYLPEFTVEDKNAGKNITARHLLTHSSGIDGDFFVEADYGRDKLERYVEKCTLLPQIHPVGQATSYCNSGFNIAGRIVEVLTGLTWEEAMYERILKPLGMDHAVLRAEDTLKLRTAIGHVPLPDQDPNKKKTFIHTPMPYLQSPGAPAGTSATMTAADLIKFAKLHLNSGRTDNKTLLSDSGVKAMQNAQYDIPRHAPVNAAHWGLGWMLMDWNGKRLIGHDGSTVGQNAFLRLIPDQDIAVALLTNGEGVGKMLYKTMYAKLLSALADYTMPEDPEPSGLNFDLEPYTGIYENLLTRYEVTAKNDQLIIKSNDKIFPEKMCPPATITLSAIEKDCFASPAIGNKSPMLVNFIDKNKNGQSKYLFCGFRMYKRSL